jgi:preprotein translocase subunit SecF
MEEAHSETQKKSWHDKYYKVLLIIPLSLVVFSFIYLGLFYSQHNDIMLKDISLTGGTSVTLNDNLINVADLENFLQNRLEEMTLKEISDLTTGEKVAIIIETKTDAETTREILEEYLNYELTDENSSIEFTGSSLSTSFYKQLLIALLVSFVFMSLVVFLLFKNAVPAGAVIFSAFADILMTLVTVNILGIKMSSAGIISLLMLIGYSVDSDILLTNRLLRRHEGTLNEKISGAFKTGITMTLTSLIALVVAFFVVNSFSSVLSQIFTILIIGLIFDIFNTWITNVSILKWYLERKK